MPRPWTVLDAVSTPEGALELRRRGESDFMISVGGRVLMTSMITRSELALAEVGVEAMAEHDAPRILIGGLGLGFTLRAALDALPGKARIVVAELNERVVDWCRGPAAQATQGAALDKRVRIVVGDVTQEIRRVALDPSLPRYDAILWDLYVGPADSRHAARDPLYGLTSMQNNFRALSHGGVFGVWCETPTPSFERRLEKAGFSTRLVRTKGGGLHHAVYLATRGSVPAPRAPGPRAPGPRAPGPRGGAPRPAGPKQRSPRG